jgi:hypothetical protein
MTVSDEKPKGLPFMQARREGQRTVVRNAEGRIVKDDIGKPKAAVVPRKGASKETWRRYWERLTNGGKDLLEAQYNIAMGTPVVPTLPDGRKGEPMVPSFEVQRATIKDMLDFGLGKAVEQTSVAAAEENEQERMRLQAMSDADLNRIIDGEVLDVKQLPEGEE